MDSGKSLDERRARFARSRDPVESVREDIARYVGATMDLHAQDLAAVCRTVEATLLSRPDRLSVLAYQEPRSAEAESLWQERFRQSGAARARDASAKPR